MLEEPRTASLNQDDVGQDQQAPGVSEVSEAVAGLQTAFQPIVDLTDGTVVAYEALTRGPVGRPLERPDRLFATAREHDLTAWVDWACRAAAFDNALGADLIAPATLFVNVEPEAIDTPCPAPWQQTMARAQTDLRTIFEVTERALASKPAELLRVVEEIRAQGSGIALDDVGVDWRSLALMPLIRPDVVKLDIQLVQAPLTIRGALIAEAVRVYAAQSGAQIVAEGIENDTHLRRALALGATLGQGWRYGRPGPLPAQHERNLEAGPQFVVTPRTSDDSSPMDAIAHHAAPTIATKAELVAISRSLEKRAMDTTEPSVLLSVFQNAEWFTPATARLYSQLASRSAFVGAFGHGMPSEPAPGVRGASLPVNEHLLGEWSVILITPHYTGALIAQDLGDDGPHMQRRFCFTLLHDHDLVLRAARSLMLKMNAVHGH